MAKGIARRRADKALRRKKVLAERRKLAQPETMLPRAERMQRMASAPLHSCLVQEGLFERGNGMVILTRRTAPGSRAMAAFLLDVWCLGVKDVIFRQVDVSELDDFVAAMAAQAPFAPVDPSYARKLLHDLVAWARSLGFPPHADYAAAELLFGDSATEACDVIFAFGRDRKPVYIPGPGDTPAQTRQRTENLRRRLGGDGFGMIEMLPLPGDDDFADDDFIDDDPGAQDVPGYDPAERPDPAAWLALDEGEKLSRVEDYHRRAGISPPNPTLHSLIHVVVENQIADGDTVPVRRTMERLMAEGLNRHEALHAVGSALAEHFHDIARAATTGAISNEAYFAALQQLTAESWRREWEAEDEP